MNELKVKKGILLAYGELFLKSEGVRKIFLRRLFKNVDQFLSKNKNIKYKLYFFRERAFVETDKIKKTEKIIKNVFGIPWFAPAFYFPKIDLKELSRFVKKYYPEWIKRNQTFALNIKVDKSIKISREKAIKEIAKEINRRVNLSKPQKEIFIEMRKNGAFLFLKKKKGAGGLPLGSGGKALVLVSGGIDSPVAAYFGAKRGIENVWVHFHSFPIVSKKSIEKIELLAREFLKFQPKLKVYFIPFSKAQLEIKSKAEAKYRVLLYRRLMFKTAEKIAKKEECGALITGESLGQVSSQTLDNFKITNKEIKIPVLRPLVGMDKEEIIALSKKIKTYDISIKFQEDCCTLFVSKHQSAKGDIKKIQEIEKKLKIKKMLDRCLQEAELKVYC